VPDATYLVWLDCRALGLDGPALREFMIKKAKLGLNDGSAFCPGLSGYMRLNAACPRSVLEKALGQLKAAVDEM
jgi:cystathionine beta-lyase